MARMGLTSWEHIYRAREEGRIPRVWKRGHLREHLQEPAGPFSRNTINAIPSNYYITNTGSEMGYLVRMGDDPRVWLVGRGQYQLIRDPDDDAATQEAEARRAAGLAEELRSRNGSGGEQPHEAPTPYPESPVRPDPETQSVPGSPDLYPSVPVALTSTDLTNLDGLSTENKALYIVHKHLLAEYGDQAEVEEDRDGADLRVSVDGRIERIEVKGTESSTLAWPQLKVSSQKSHDALISGDASIYRVVEVSSANPRIYFLTHGRHFNLEPEPRWAVKRVPQGDSRYPLRGEPYRYDRPYDPVAAEEWEALG